MTSRTVLTSAPRPPLVITGEVRYVCIEAEKHIRNAFHARAPMHVGIEGYSEDDKKVSAYLHDVVAELRTWPGGHVQSASE